MLHSINFVCYILFCLCKESVWEVILVVWLYMQKNVFYFGIFVHVWQICLDPLPPVLCTNLRCFCIPFLIFGYLSQMDATMLFVQCWRQHICTSRNNSNAQHRVSFRSKVVRGFGPFGHSPSFFSCRPTFFGRRQSIFQSQQEQEPMRVMAF